MKSYQLVLIFALVVGLVYYSRERFSMPDSSVLPACPVGTERAPNGKDCQQLNDRFTF